MDYRVAASMLIYSTRNRVAVHSEPLARVRESR